MTQIAASAPGKAVISGEYAVLHGAPAIAMAVGCRARVTAVAVPGDRSHSVRSAGCDPVHFRCGRDQALEWLDGRPHEKFQLFEQVWRHAKAATRERPHTALTLDTRAFFDAASGLKLGLGSSAALAVALAAALHEGDHELAAATAAAAHLAFQSGKGSGLDIATAVHGGLIGFTRDQPVRELTWPAGLQYSFYWCGKPSSTLDKLIQAEAAGLSASARRATSALTKAAEDVSDTWLQGSDVDIVASFEAYIAALRQFSDASQLGMFDAGHGELCEIAAEYGLAYKPCGAGGGDIGIVLAPQTADTAEFTARAEGLHFVPLPCVLEAQGVSVGQRST